MGRLNWGGLAIGAIGGLGVAAALSIILLAIGVRLGDSPGGDAAFAMVQFGGLIVAGYIGGRFSPGDAMEQTTHGAIAALVLFAVSAAIALAADQDIGPGALAGGGIVALVLGSVGGTFSARRRS